MKVAVIILAIVAIVAAGVAGFAIWRMDSSVTVPDVVGDKAADAVGELTGAGLAYSVEHTYDNDVKQGEVAKQQPAPGKAAQGSMVVLWVSDGVENVQVPDVTGQTVDQADAALTAAGLNPRQVAGSSADVQKGHIYKMVPAVGANVPRGSIITVYYSHTSPTVPVPSLAGLTEAQAADRLTSKKLYLGSVGTQQSSTVTQGLVISQSVPATEPVARGTKVSVVISSGPPEPVVPDVVNMPYVQAQNKLTALGFQVRITWTPGAGMSPNAVVKVVPAVGTPAPEGSLVHIYVEEGGGPYM
jgi:eukaryotic-like serine/threonine-protein kinase